jgi:drug/metabolite transporter (DMT)-like permease
VRRAPVPPLAVLAVSVIAISTSAVLVRLTEGMHPVVIGLGRTAAVALLLAPTLRGSGADLRGLGARGIGLTAAAGLMLALHFWVWFASLAHTTVMRGTLLVCLTPVWAGALEWAVLGARPPRQTWAGMAVALVGVGLMAGGAAGGGAAGSTLRGDLLAVLGGMLAAVYLLLGRAVRARLGVGPYGSLMCAAAALTLLPVALAGGLPMSGFGGGAWLALLGLVLGPQLLGHIGMNYAVGYLPATVVGLGVLLEPVGATVLGAVVLGEVPSAQELAGGAVVTCGVGLATWRPRRPAAGAAGTPTPG